MLSYTNMFKDGTAMEISRNIKSYLYALIGLAAAVAADQAAKLLAAEHLKDKEPFVIIDGVFQLRYLENRGAAFGMLQNRQYLFVAGAVVIFLVVAFLYGRLPHERKYIPLRICAVLVCAGAVGNMIDRVRLNYVIDFLYFNLIDFPIFNVADCYVVIACILFIILIFFYYKDSDLEFFRSGRDSRNKGK